MATPCPIGCSARCDPGCAPPCWFEGNDDVVSLIEAKRVRDSERVRAVVLEAGRPDVVADYDAAMRDLKLGVTGARSAWDALSDAQRRALVVLSEVRAFVRYGSGRYRFGGLNFGVRTIRALASRELVAWDGGAFDPEARVVVTERGDFVLRHGGGLMVNILVTVVVLGLMLGLLIAAVREHRNRPKPEAPRSRRAYRRDSGPSTTNSDAGAPGFYGSYGGCGGGGGSSDGGGSCGGGGGE